GRLAEPGGQEQAEHAPVREDELRVGGQVTVNEVGNVELLQQRGNQGQGTEGEGVVGQGGAVPGLSHNASAANQGDAGKAVDSRWQSNSTGTVKREAVAGKAAPGSTAGSKRLTMVRQAEATRPPLIGNKRPSDTGVRKMGLGEDPGHARGGALGHDV